MLYEVTEQFRRSLPTTVCRHFSRLLQCRFCYINADGSVRCAYAFGQPAPRVEDGDLMNALFVETVNFGRPIIKEARPGEMYISVDLYIGGAFCGRLAAGPVSSAAGASEGAGGEAEAYENAVSAASLMYSFAYGEWPDEKELMELCREGRASEKKEKAAHTARQKEAIRHHSVVYENHVFSRISEGDEKKLLEIIKLPPDGAFGLLDREHPLRNLKDDCICTITLATRAAIAGGLDSETALSMSDEAIQSIEKHRDVDGLYQLTVRTMTALARSVAETKQLGLSYRINRCRSYVLNHLEDKLTIVDIANHFGLTPEYLSSQFKKETGMRLIDFINTARAEEARKLLMFSEKPILEIASLLNYHDQSHFTKAFKKVFGMTPAAFREGKSV